MGGSKRALKSAPAKTVAALRKAAAERDQYLDLAARTRAEFENYQKRMQRERGAGLRAVDEGQALLLAQFDGVDARLRGQHIDVRLARVRVGVVARRAPRPQRHMGVGEHAFDAQIGERIGGGGEALDGLRIEPLGLEPQRKERQVDADGATNGDVEHRHSHRESELWLKPRHQAPF